MFNNNLTLFLKKKLKKQKLVNGAFLSTFDSR